MKWYYVENGNTRVGPVEDEAFNKLVAEGKIDSTTLVWKQGMEDWQPYGQISQAAPTEEKSVEKAEPQEEEKKLKCSQCGNLFPESDLIQYQDLKVCANCKPAFLQKIKEGVTVLGTSASDTYGSIEKGVNGQYSFSISDILSEAWDIMKGTKRYILGGTIVMYVILFIISACFELTKLFLVGASTSHSGVALGIDVISQIATAIISYPITAGIMMIGIRRSVGLPVDFSIIFNYFHKTMPLVLMYLLSMVLITAGILLLIIPGIYLAFAYMMAMPLVVEKDLSPWEALETSRKAITNQWFKVAGFFIVIGLILIASILLLGIGLIWTMPLACVAFGILYRTIFGVEELRGK